MHGLKNSKHLLSHYFCGSGIQKRLIWVLWLRVSPEIAGKLRLGLRSHLKAPLGEDQLPRLLAWLLNQGFLPHPEQSPTTACFLQQQRPQKQQDSAHPRQEP